MSYSDQRVDSQLAIVDELIGKAKPLFSDTFPTQSENRRENKRENKMLSFVSSVDAFLFNMTGGMRSKL